jgi:hypothetical protein
MDIATTQTAQEVPEVHTIKPARLPAKLIAHIKKATGLNISGMAAEDYTAENITTIRDTITTFYAVQSTICNMLVSLRSHLKGLGVDTELIVKSHNPEVTKKQNEISKKRLQERADNGDIFPKDLTILYLVVNRINNFITRPYEEIAQAGQTHFIVVDIFLMNRCRSKELDTMEISQDGKITDGVLKKRGKEYTYDFCSFVPVETYSAYMAKFNALDDFTRKALFKQKELYLALSGITTRSLREIGATLSLRSKIIGGSVKCLTAINGVMGEVLRHKKIQDANDNYSTILDTLLPLKAKLDECDESTIKAIAELVDRDLSKKAQTYGISY